MVSGGCCGLLAGACHTVAHVAVPAGMPHSGTRGSASTAGPEPRASGWPAHVGSVLVHVVTRTLPCYGARVRACTHTQQLGCSGYCASRQVQVVFVLGAALYPSKGRRAVRLRLLLVTVSAGGVSLYGRSGQDRAFDQVLTGGASMLTRTQPCGASA
jgi:hypothetical protein